MKRIALLLCALVALWSAQAQAAAFNQVAAVINGQMISLFDLQTAVKPEMIKSGLKPDNPAQRTALDQLYRRALENMILDILIGQEAERQKVTVSTAEVDGEITRVMKQSRLAKADFEKQLAREGLTPDSLRDRVRKTLLRQKLMGMMVGRKVVVTPEEVAAYYEANKDKIRSGGTLRMALLIYPDNADAASWARKIKAGNAKFGDVVRQLSIGPNKQGGGDVGPVPLEKLGPNWRQILSKLNEGEVSPVFPYEGKKAQVQLLQAPKAAGTMTLAEATPMIENILREPRLQERFAEYTEQLRKKAVIDIRL